MTEMVSYFLLHVSFAVKLWMCFCQQGWCYCHCIFHRWLHTYIGKLVSSDCSLSMACLHPLLITGSAPARFMWKSLFGRSALSCDGSWWCPLFAQLAWSGRVCVYRFTLPVCLQSLANIGNNEAVWKTWSFSKHVFLSSYTNTALHFALAKNT